MQLAAPIHRRRNAPVPRQPLNPIPICVAPPRAQPLRKAGCSCGGGCPACKTQDIAGPDHPAEREADAVAARVMSMSGPDTAVPVQRMPEMEEDDEVLQRQPEEEEMLQARAEPGGAIAPNGNPMAGLGSGQPLSTATRAFFEPRFGRSFAHVRIHDGVTAQDRARSVNARAFAYGRNIVFNHGRYSPESHVGRHLLAHELTHVVQQAGNRQYVQRTVGANSTCPANADSAPADPLGRLATIDARAQSMALVVAVLDPTRVPSIITAYRRRFGDPPAVGRRFRNRFTRRRFDTQNEALMSEMVAVADLFLTIHDRLAQDIRYRCAGTRRITVENCAAHRCGTDEVAFVCPGSNMRDIAICPGFWVGLSDDQRAGGLIHEVVHARLNRPGHPQAVGRRHRAPECFTSFVSEIYGFIPFDEGCPPLP